MKQSEANTILASQHGYGESTLYRRILELLMDPLEADLAAHLPATPEELARTMGIPVEMVNQQLDRLFKKGIIYPRNFQTREGYRFARNVNQLLNGTLCDSRWDESLGPKLFDLWQEFCQTSDWSAKQAEKYAEHQNHYPERIIPAYKAIQNVPGVLPSDDMRELLRGLMVEKAALVAATLCSCRRRVRACDKSMDICLQVGRPAEYALSRGNGKKVSFDEVLEMLDKAEDEGLVHYWPTDISLTPLAVCFCCVCCCVSWAPLNQHGVSIGNRWKKSRFEARVQHELCNGCQICVERCQFDAITMVKPTKGKILKASVDPQKCWGCGLCVIKCKPGALSMKGVRDA